MHQPRTLALLGLAAALVVALPARAASVAEDAERFLLRVDLRMSWGCSRGGGSRTLAGPVSLVLKGGRAVLAAELRGHRTSYGGFGYGALRRVQRSSQAQAYLRRYEGSVRWQGKILDLDLRSGKSSLKLHCETSQLAVRPARPRGSGAPQANVAAPSKSVPVLRCTPRGTALPAPLTELRAGGALQLGAGRGIELLRQGRWSGSTAIHAL